MPRTKMVFTIGPATDQPGILRKLIQAGMNCARFNASHGSHAEHSRRFRQLRSLSRSLDKPVAALLDLGGPKLRVGRFERGGIHLTRRSEIRLTPKPIIGKPGIIPMSYPRLAREIKRGEPVLLDDGLLRLRVLRTEKEDVICRVEAGGMLSDHKGMNFPGVSLRVAALTPKDKDDLAFGLKLGFDFIALSFVQQAAEMHSLRNLVEKSGSRAGIIAKIEKPQAIPHLDEIIRASDGIMIARGDLAVEMSPEQVPVLQKKIITQSNHYGRFVITATQMLQSMMDSPVPTRAEATDVANAVFDGTDAIMLSGESAAGKYPVQSAEMMARIATAAESSPEYNRLHLQPEAISSDDHVVAAGVALAEKVNARALVVFTHAGNTARLVSRQRPMVRICALPHSPKVQRNLQLNWGIEALLMKARPSLEGGVEKAEQFLRSRRLVKTGDVIVVLASSPNGSDTNIIKVHKIK